MDTTTVTAGDGAAMRGDEAAAAWEAGEFCDWVDQHGFPLMIGGKSFESWRGVEQALAELWRGGTHQ